MAVLLVVTVSVVLDEIVAVLVIGVRFGAVVLTLTIKVNEAVPAVAKVPRVTKIVPVPPADGALMVNVGPLVCIIETNVVLAGTASFTTTACASLGPLLVTVIV